MVWLSQIARSSVQECSLPLGPQGVSGLTPFAVQLPQSQSSQINLVGAPVPRPAPFPLPEPVGAELAPGAAGGGAVYGALLEDLTDAFNWDNSF